MELGSLAAELVSEGRFKEAAEHLRAQSPDARNQPALAILEAEVLMELGDLRRAFSLGERALRRPLVTDERTQLLKLLAQIAYYEGRRDNCLDLFRQAEASALERRQDRPELYASVLLAAWRLVPRAHAFSSSDIEISHVRRAVLRSGSAHGIIELRAGVAENEARKSNPYEALRHLDAALTLLKSYPNMWLEGIVLNHTSVVYAILGDLATAIEWAHRSLERARLSGHFRVKVSAQINLSEWYRVLGMLDRAEDILTDVLRAVDSHVHLRAGALDSLTNLRLARNDLNGAGTVFRELLSLRRHSLRGLNSDWFRLSELFSRARLLESRGKQGRALDLLRVGLRKARDTSDRVWENRLRVYLSRLACELGRTDQAVEQLVRVETGHSRGAETFLQVCGVRAKIEELVGHADSSTRFELRTNRILNALRGQDATVQLTNEPNVAANGVPALVLDDAVALIELAGYPHVLAREAFALLETSGAALAQALVARGSAVRCLAARNWTETEAVAAATTPGDRLQIVCGTHRDETWEVIAETKPGLHDRCTAVALQKLVDTAVTLDRFRREEKQRAALWPADTMETDGGLWVSEQMLELLAIARRIAPSNITVLLTGETGTGKEVLARAIHRASARAAKPFVPFNCTAVPRDMLESQLFGYRKGAFTGADAPFEGVIRAAAGGTLFLDEIAEIGPELQPKLLRFLETHEVHGLGEPQPVAVDVRVIAATNADVETLVAGGRLREDLFYRLNVARLRLPPLRERREEIPPLIDCYVRKFADEQKKGHPTVDDETLEYLVLYAWPGNVRQLVNEISRIIAFVEPDGRVTPALLSPDIQASRRTVRVLPGDEPEIRIRLDQPLGDAVDLIEQMMIRRALERARGNYENAARLLGISRKGLFLKRRRWGLERAS